MDGLQALQGYLSLGQAVHHIHFSGHWRDCGLCRARCLSWLQLLLLGQAAVTAVTIHIAILRRLQLPQYGAQVLTGRVQGEGKMRGNHSCEACTHPTILL